MDVWILDSNLALAKEFRAALTQAGFFSIIGRSPDEIDPVKGDIVLVNLDTVGDVHFPTAWEITHTENQTSDTAHMIRPFPTSDLVEMISFFCPGNVKRFPLFCTNCGSSFELNQMRYVYTVLRNRPVKCPRCDLPHLAEAGTDYLSRKMKEAV